jgi:hypothetical protein
MAVLMLSAAMPASAHVNLLQNPGFETGSSDPWGIDGDGYHWEGGVDSPGHTGTYYAWLEVDEAEAGVLQHFGPPRCAQSLEFWYRGGWEEDGILGVEIYYSVGSDLEQELSPTEEWSFVHIDLDTARLVEAVEAFVGAVFGGIDVDDFDLEACPAPAVGGVVMPANNFSIVAPWLIMIGLVGCIGTVVVAKKRRP